MDKTAVIEEFKGQLEAITIDTPYYADGTKAVSELEQRIRHIMFVLWLDANSKRLAEHLERNMESHFEQLYEFSYGVPSYSVDGPTMFKKVDTLAIMIIEEKEIYQKRIKRLKERYERFKTICNKLLNADKKLFVDYFERSEKVDYKRLRSAVRCYLSIIEPIYDEQINKQNEKQKQVKPGLRFIKRKDVEQRLKIEFRQEMIELFGEDYPFE